MICPACARDTLLIRNPIGKVEVLCPSCNRWTRVTIELIPLPPQLKVKNFVLVVNLQKPYVSYKGHNIRTEPPNHLQNQYLFSLYILAKYSGAALNTGKIWSRMNDEGLLDFLRGRKTTALQAPEAKYIRQGILKPIRVAFNGQPDENVDELIKTISSPKPPRLMLNLPKEKVLCIGLQDKI